MYQLGSCFDLQPNQATRDDTSSRVSSPTAHTAAQSNQSRDYSIGTAEPHVNSDCIGHACENRPFQYCTSESPGKQEIHSYTDELPC